MLHKLNQGDIRIACDKDHPDYTVLAKLALGAIYDMLGGPKFSDALGRRHGVYNRCHAYAVNLFKAGELKYEEAEHCMADGVMVSSGPGLGEFEYCIPCKGFSNDAWNAGVSPIMHCCAYAMDCDMPDLLNKAARRIPLRTDVAHVVHSHEGPHVRLRVSLSAFAHWIDLDDYTQFVRAALRYGMTPTVNCQCVLFNDKGMQNLLAYVLDAELHGTKSEDIELEVASDLQG